MPNTKSKYKLTVDATVTVNHLKLGEKSATLSNNGNTYEGEVTSIEVADTLFVDLLLSGPAGEWSLDVFVFQDGVAADKAWRKIADNSITGNISTKNSVAKNCNIDWI